MGLTNLQVLNLWETHVSELEPLAGLTNLQTLNLRETRVSAAQIARLIGEAVHSLRVDAPPVKRSAASPAPRSSSSPDHSVSAIVQDDWCAPLGNSLALPEWAGRLDGELSPRLLCSCVCPHRCSIGVEDRF